MSRPTRATVDGRAYLDLQNLARAAGRPTAELQQLYGLEGFLLRLAGSGRADQLVLKGGVLLAAFGTRRATRDVDLQASDLSNDIGATLDVVRKIVAITADDGLVFDPVSASAAPIRDEDEYSGVRVSLSAALSRARLRFHVDVNFGDPIWPAPDQVRVPRLLGGFIELTGYPLHMVYAEKLVTALDRGTANTRWRDFGDMWTLSCRHHVAGSDLQEAVRRVAEYRDVPLEPLAEVLAGYDDLADPRWQRWRAKQELRQLPVGFGAVLARVTALADPAIAGEVGSAIWSPVAGAWQVIPAN